MNDRAMSLMQHLDELRRRMLRASLIALALIVLALIFFRQILDFVSAPVEDVIADAGGTLTVLRLTEPWTVAVRISVLTGLTAALPVYMWEIGMFLRSGLRRREQGYLLLLAPGSALLFAAGAAFAYFGLAPYFFRFLLGVGGSIEGIQLNPSLDSTTNLLISLMFSLGMVFQIPMVMLGLAKLGIVDSAWFSRKRRWVILLAFILGAALTPTVDPLTQLMVALPTILLFELGLLLIRIFVRKPKAEASNLPAATR